MHSMDWRDLYERNQAAIRRSGIPLDRMQIPAAGGLPGGVAGLPHSLTALRPSVGSDPRRDTACEERTFTVGGRRRRALVYAPAGIGADTAPPLVCMLHGCRQDPASFAAATGIEAAAQRHGFAVVLPAQERADNAMGCWNWFERHHRMRDQGEPAAIAGIVGQLRGDADLRIDPRRVFVCGLSSGGAMAAILAATHPDLFAAAAIHSGLAYGAASDLSSAFAAMSNGGPDADAQGRAAHAAMGRHARAVPTMVIHGTADTTVAPVNAHQALRQTLSANRLAAPECADLDATRPSTSARARVDGGHAYTRSRWIDRRGALMHELVLVEGMGHGWSGGTAGEPYTDHRGPDAAYEIVRFFAQAGAGRAAEAA
jgi:poly(hydroxyalkanoate) depolymerase family esterase